MVEPIVRGNELLPFGVPVPFDFVKVSTDMAEPSLEARVFALEQQFERESASKYWVREQIEAGMEPLVANMREMQKVVTEQAHNLTTITEMIKRTREDQAEYMRQRAERENAEAEARMRAIQLEHEARVAAIQKETEEKIAAAKSSSMFSMMKDRWQPVLDFIVKVALVMGIIGGLLLYWLTSQGVVINK
jgi:hypothetical protein